MLGFDPLTAGALLIMAATASPQQAASACPSVAPTKINVVPKTQEVAFDYSRSIAQLQAVQSDTIDPYDFHGVTMTQGFMEGQIKLKPSIKLNYKHMPLYNGMCLWYESIDIELEIDPKIVIASEVYADPCMRKAVTEHEMKHVKTDRKIVNKYAKSMGNKVYQELKERGFKTGPVKSEYAQNIADRMNKVVYQIIEHEYKKMDLERVELQREVDNIQEYERVNALCPDFRTKQEAAMKKKKKYF